MALLIVGSGLISAALIALGFGLVVPVSALVGDLCDLLAIGSGIFSSGCSPASSGPHSNRASARSPDSNRQLDEDVTFVSSPNNSCWRTNLGVPRRENIERRPMEGARRFPPRDGLRSESRRPPRAAAWRP